MLDFKSDIKNAMEISGNRTSYIEKVCLCFVMYEVQLSDILIANFLYRF